MAEDIEQGEDAMSFFKDLPPLDDVHPRNTSFDSHYGDITMQEAALGGMPWIPDSSQNDSLYSSYMIPSQKLFEDDSFECGNEFKFQPNDPQVICSENYLAKKVVEPVITKSEEQAKGFGRFVEQESNTDSKKLSMRKISEYFYLPIREAADELNVGLTRLKKSCREYGISRWPYRKLKSLQSVMENVQVLHKEEGEGGSGRISHGVKIVEDQIRVIEEAPNTKLDEETKRLRQACFKANYKKKKSYL